MRARSLGKLIALACAITAVAVTAFPIHGQDPPKTADQNANLGLLERVAKLEARVVELEQQKEPRVIGRTNDESGHLIVGDLAICWGRKELPRDQAAPDADVKDRGHTWSFSFVYPVKFASKPAVTTGFDMTSGGHVVGVYNSEVSGTEFRGQVWDPRFNQHQPPVAEVVIRMNYVAIGKVKK